jgi:hypothetical protein
MMYKHISYRVLCPILDEKNICSLADLPQKESDALQEKIAALVAEQSARQGLSTSY